MKWERLIKWVVYVGWLIMFVFGAVGVYLRLTEQLKPTALGSYVVWGLWISADIYFIGLSAGAFFVSSFVYVFRVKILEPLGKLALFTALIGLFLAMLTAWADIGHMERFYYIFIRPNFKSIMTWMVWGYMAYFLLLLLELWFAIRVDLVNSGSEATFRGRLCRLLAFGRTETSDEAIRRDHRILRILGSIGVPLAIGFHGGMGALFATLVARPYWNVPLYPIFFLFGALTSGSALLLALAVFLWPQRNETWQQMVGMMGRVVVGLLAFDLLLEWAEISVPAWYGIGGEIKLFQVILFGPFWWVFWIVHILLGVIIPLFLLLGWPKKPNILGLAGLLVAVTYMSVRLNIVIPVLITPEF